MYNLQSEWILKRLPFTWTHTQRRLYHISVTFLVMCCLKICRPLSHTIMLVSSRYEFFWGRSAAKFLCKFCSSFGSYLGVGVTAWWNKRGCLPFQKSNKGNTTRRLRTLIELTHCLAGRKRTHNRSRTWQAFVVESVACESNTCQIIWIIN